MRSHLDRVFEIIVDGAGPPKSGGGELLVSMRPGAAFDRHVVDQLRGRPVAS